VSDTDTTPTHMITLNYVIFSNFIGVDVSMSAFDCVLHSLQPIMVGLCILKIVSFSILDLVLSLTQPHKTRL